MTQRADFYILSGADLKRRDVYACRLVEKAFLAGLSVAVLADEERAARTLDDLLWTFNERSFVPHQLCLGAAAPDPQTPVRIHTELPAAAAAGPVATAVAAAAAAELIAPAADLVLNLSTRMPAMLERLTRVAVVVDEDAERRRIGREHFKIYRERSFEMQTHRIDSFE